MPHTRGSTREITLTKYTFSTPTPFVSVGVSERYDGSTQYRFFLANGDHVSVVPAFIPTDFESAYIPAGDESGNWDVRTWDGKEASPESVALAHLAAIA